MNIFQTTLIIILGLSFGSFINAAVYRLKNKKPLMRGRSQCPKCGKKLSALEIVPILSFVLQKGKCRYCQKNIAWQYPLTELFTGIIFLLFYIIISPQNINQLILLVGYLIFSVFLIAIFIYDLKYYLIPDIIVIPGFLLAAAFSLINYNITFLQSFLGFSLTATFFMIFVLISKEKWMGWGDVKLGLFIGALTGWPIIIVNLFIAFVAGAAFGLILVVAKKKNIKSVLPFGTFLTASTFISLLWGEKIINWYLKIIGY